MDAIGDKFDELHEQLFTFSLEEEKELVNLRAVVKDQALSLKASAVKKGSAKPSKESIISDDAKVYMDGKNQKASIYDRKKLKSGNVIKGPAIVMEMDSTTVILSKHKGKVDKYGNILITPQG